MITQFGAAVYSLSNNNFVSLNRSRTIATYPGPEPPTTRVFNPPAHKRSDIVLTTEDEWS